MGSWGPRCFMTSYAMTPDDTLRQDLFNLLSLVTAMDNIDIAIPRA